VIDFGIASGVSNTRLTMTNVAVGTPAYMSPEQARDSRSVTGASDVFSLGSTLVFAATGHAPFHGANPVETVFMLLREGPELAAARRRARRLRPPGARGAAATHAAGAAVAGPAAAAHGAAGRERPAGRRRLGRPDRRRARRAPRRRPARRGRGAPARRPG